MPQCIFNAVIPAQCFIEHNTTENMARKLESNHTICVIISWYISMWFRAFVLWRGSEMVSL